MVPNELNRVHCALIIAFTDGSEVDAGVFSSFHLQHKQSKAVEESKVILLCALYNVI